MRIRPSRTRSAPATARSHAGTSNAFVPVVNDPGPFPGSNLDTTRSSPRITSTRTGQPDPEPDLRQPAALIHGPKHQEIIATDQNPSRTSLTFRTTSKSLRPSTRRSTGAGISRASMATMRLTATAQAEPSTARIPATSCITTARSISAISRKSAGAEQQPARRQGLLDAVEGRKLPRDGGVFYLRGGYNNNDGLVPVDPTGHPERVPRQ